MNDNITNKNSANNITLKAAELSGAIAALTATLQAKVEAVDLEGLNQDLDTRKILLDELSALMTGPEKLPETARSKLKEVLRKTYEVNVVIEELARKKQSELAADFSRAKKQVETASAYQSAGFVPDAANGSLFDRKG
jgi:hypothetical protein